MLTLADLILDKQMQINRKLFFTAVICDTSKDQRLKRTSNILLRSFSFWKIFLGARLKKRIGNGSYPIPLELI